MSHEELLREAFRRWNAGEYERSQEFMHPEVSWHTSGLFPDLDPVYRGLDGVRRFWRDFTAPWEEIVLEPVEITVGGDEAVVVSHFRARGRGGIEVDQQTYNRYTFRDGKVFLVEGHQSHEAALAAAGLGDAAS